MCRTLPPELMLDAGLADFDLAVSTEIFTKGVGERWRDWSDTTLAWHRTTLQLPHHLGGFGLTPACASSIAAFYTATASSVRWFSGLSDPTFWIKDEVKTHTLEGLVCVLSLRERHDFSQSIHPSCLPMYIF